MGEYIENLIVSSSTADFFRDPPPKLDLPEEPSRGKTANGA